MTDLDLEKLARRAAPAADASARAQALAAAMQAFDDAEKMRMRPKVRPMAGVEAPSSTGYGAPS